VYTDHPEVLASGGNDLFSRFLRTGSPPGGTPTPTFSVLGSTTGPSSESLPVGFMDGNFNRMSAFTTYSIAPLGSGVVNAKFLIPPGVPDGLGMSFTQLYCDSATSPTQCSSACATAPCYVVTNVGSCALPGRTGCTGFSYGNWSSAGITGSCSNPSGDTVMVTATINNVSTLFGIAGTCTP
jgi:hypothetical protein